ncbi:uncharacterized protein [Phyllobates terribilis]|uniref:uncharacterized protein n=1 Tax=Phyllobates terribilis TaxID=111132 RepID=UPI003CCB2081
MEFVRNMERRRLIKPQDILATLQSIPEDESESELQEHAFDSDSDEDFIPQNISSESEDSEGTNPEDIPSTSTGDRAHAVMLPRDHPPGRGQKKSAKRPRNERTTDNDGGEGNATTNTREGESEGILVSADGIQWKPVEIGEHLPGRRDSQNILREAPGPTGYARRNIIIDSPLSAWRLFFESYILTHIKNCTLAEACRNNNLQFTLSDEELDAFIAIFYARGISGMNRHSISSIWCNDWGIPFCKATMSRDRFVEIMRFLRFDEKSTRSERLQTDKFALFSTVWDRFIENYLREIDQTYLLPWTHMNGELQQSQGICWVVPAAGPAMVNWCSRKEVISSCGQLPIQLENLHNEEQTAITTTKEQIKNIESQLTTSISPEDFQALQSKIQTNIDLHKRDTETRKRNKFARDLEDYEQNRAKHEDDQTEEDEARQQEQEEIWTPHESPDRRPTTGDMELQRFYRTLRLKTHFANNPFSVTPPSNHGRYHSPRLRSPL